MTHEFLEGSMVPPLRFADQHRVVDTVSLPSHVAPCGGVLGSATLVRPGAVHARVRTFANRNWYRPRFGRHVSPLILSKPMLEILLARIVMDETAPEA